MTPQEASEKCAELLGFLGPTAEEPYWKEADGTAYGPEAPNFWDDHSLAWRLVESGMVTPAALHAELADMAFGTGLGVGACLLTLGANTLARWLTDAFLRANGVEV